ncbi:MAG: EAL domain-containing protein [Truepera sp.]|nr:EAL domain-containing protein [Truepera sp.]
MGSQRTELSPGSEPPPEPVGTGTTAVVETTARLFGDECFCISDLGAVGHPIVHASVKFAELTGFQADEVVGRNLGFLMRNDTYQEGERLLREAVAANRPVTTTVRTYRADGSLMWLEQRHYPVHDGGGEASHLLTLFRDVTGEVHVEGAQAMQLELSGSLEGDGRFFSYALLLHDDGRNEVAWASEAWQQLTGYGVADLQKQGMERFVHPEDRGHFRERLQGLRDAERRSDQYRVVTLQGKVMWVEDFASRRWRSDEAGITAVYGMMKDVSNARRDHANLWHLAHVDSLTGLPNAHLLEDRIQQAQLQARRNGTSVALAILDLDNFRFVNQTFSQRHGDRVIAEVSRRLRRTLRRTDTLARLDGDAFALLLADLPAPRDVLPALDKVLMAVREPYADGSLTLNLSASIGVDMQRSSVRAANQVLERANAALVRAKETSRGGFRFFDDETDVAMRSRVAIVSELRRAIAEDQLVLHYQPRVQLDDGAIHSVEALVRWLHPVRGLLKPVDFVPLIEESQLGPQLFEWVVERACRQAKRWQRQRTPRRVAVNVSPSTLAHADIGGIVQKVLARYDLHPGLLELEISERTGHDTLAMSADKLDGMRAMGMQVALDDFGVAHSSLTQLRALPLDGLKIDRSFVTKLDARTPGQEIDLLRAIIALGKSLRLRVTAEGIETREQNDIMRNLHCDDGQGFLYSHPVPAEYLPASA